MTATTLTFDTCRIVTQGWPMILSSLKSLLETGDPFVFPMPG